MRAPLDLLLLFAAVYAGFGMLSPFLPALLAGRGLDAAVIGYAIAGGGLVKLAVTPPLGRLADARRAVRLALAAACAASALAAFSYAAPLRGVALVALVLAQAAMLAPTAPFADAISVSAAEQGKASYGFVRGAGSASFFVATIASGALAAAWGWTATALAQAILLAIAAPLAFFAPEPAGAAAEHDDAAQEASWRDLMRLRAFRRIVVIAALILGSHALHDGFAIVYWTQAGVSPRLAGVLWAESVATEVVVFALVGPWLIARIGERGAMLLSAAAAILRWSAMATTAAPAVMALTEPLHGLTFALLHLACMRVIGRTVSPALAASAQSFYGAVGIGLANVVLSAVSGVLFGRLGGAAFWVMAGLAALALPVILTSGRDLSGPGVVGHRG